MQNPYLEYIHCIAMHSCVCVSVGVCVCLYVCVCVCISVCVCVLIKQKPQLVCRDQVQNIFYVCRQK